MVRVILTGFRGTGKTAAGERLAHMLGVPFTDTDAEVVKQAGMPVYEIFRQNGEDYFRALERGVVSSLAMVDSVVSTGGGVVLNPDNVAKIRARSVVFLLTADDRTIENRIAGTERPSLTRLPLRAEIHELQEQRRNTYLSSADFCIETSKRDTNETAMAIRRILDEGVAGAGAKGEALGFVQDTDIPLEEKKALEEALTGPDADPLTRIYAVAGNPCRHSLSPPVFNKLFSHYLLNCHYTRLCWPDLGDIFRVARKIEIRGLSVTIPFKSEAISHVDEPDEHVRAIGALNTVLFCCGTSYGYNTDWIGIRDALAHLKGSGAAVIGAGGVAAAAVYALRSLDMDVTVFNRTPENGKKLADRFSCRSMPLSGLDQANPDILINATPVGMETGSGSSMPVSPSILRKEMTIFDLVYTPSETRLIRAARKAGCSVIPGTELFVRQACAQFTQFTGIEPPAALIRGLVI